MCHATLLQKEPLLYDQCDSCVIHHLSLSDSAYPVFALMYMLTSLNILLK